MFYYQLIFCLFGFILSYHQSHPSFSSCPRVMSRLERFSLKANKSQKRDLQRRGLNSDLLNSGFL